MQYRRHLNKTAQLFLSLCSVAVTLAVQAQILWPSVPLGSTTSATPMTMLVAARDHRLFYEAYNDASDIGGAADGGPDGKPDLRFTPGIVYYGLFDSNLCYQYDTTGTTNKLFRPKKRANGPLLKCLNPDAQWSGNWLNYVTTSRIDALRMVLYGGFREIDNASETVLRRAYIPQDAHSWAKEYTSSTVDGYKISDYSPFEPPADGARIFFGNLTPNYFVNCTTLNNCSNIAPTLRIYENVKDRRVWQWASSQRPVLDRSGFNSGAVHRRDEDGDEFRVRVQVCTGEFITGCKQYPNGGYKPVGLLHDYGENNSMLFGLMTGSYDKNMSGGRLRKIVSSFADEVDAQTGIFKSKMSPAGESPIVQSFDNLRIRDFNNHNDTNDRGYYTGKWITNRPMVQGEFPDWGNPIGEIMYEATRYFAGKKAPTSDFAGTSTVDREVGLPIASWDDPYDADTETKVASCSKANFLTISDINPSFDSDQLPGSYFSGTLPGDLTGLNVSTLANTITEVESDIAGLRFIGQSESLDDTAPSAKTVKSLASIRGLAPEQPTRQGSYYAASVAYYANTTDLRADLVGQQTVNNFVVALSSPLTSIEVKIGEKLITLVPFGKSVKNFGISPGKNQFQPTNQIVDFYVEEIVNQTPNENEKVNGGRYSATFGINFEDVEQGGDHDMDVIARYVVQATATGSLTVTVEATFISGPADIHLGYVISGTSADGVYLVASNQGNTAYFLNVPAGRAPGYCNPATGAMPTDCNSLPTKGQTPNTFTFIPGSGTGATLLKGPLWYAAKYGAFNDRNGSNTPDLQLEWDADSNGVPDTYFEIQNPLKLRDSMKKALEGIVERRGSSGNAIANSTVLGTSTFVYQGIFNSSNWSGDLEANLVTDEGLKSNLHWRASDKMPAPAVRNITFWQGTQAGEPGKPFLWGNLGPSQKSLLDDDKNILNYLRGDRTLEIQNANNTNRGGFRSRAPTNVLGDIAHSAPIFVKDTNTVYVGANDGMLHAFDATTGAEVFAHIPSPMLPRLKDLASPAYKHEYFVDGDIAVSSRQQTSGKNYLVASMGRGAQGLFGIDVSDRVGSKAIWEYTFGNGDPDLGYMLGRPVIAQLTSGVWAVFVGNGYNSASGKAVLYVFNLVTGVLIKKIDTGVAGNNGMATPGVHLNTTGQAVAVYAGDLKGNVWKFDVSGTDARDWKIPFMEGALPLFVAKDRAGQLQPITAPMRSVVNAVTGDANFGKTFVHFGTGSDFQTEDTANTAPQSWYGLIDQGTPILSPNRSSFISSLVLRVMGAAETLASRSVRAMAEAVSGDMAGKSGFVIDLPKTGERIVTASNFYKLAEPVLIASSVIPAEDLCQPGGTGFVNFINPFTGARLDNGFGDVTGEKGFADDVMSNGSFVSSVDLDVGKPGEAILIGNRLVVGGSKAVSGDMMINRFAAIKGRISWREIVRD
jgi:type IV pilus assembly protein PilY1